MKSTVFLLLALGILGWGTSLRGEGEFLSTGEIDQVRDAQEPAKRIILYLEFAQRRLDAVMQNLASPKAKSGRTIRKNLQEYIDILDALEGSVENGRERRARIDKSLKEMEKRTAKYLGYLESLQAGSQKNLSDYQFTLEEAIAMTREEIAVAQEGSFPEVKGRKPPAQFPSQPPPVSDQPGREEGPPRKSQRVR
ncbi:MAG: hypothetical protein IH935_11435 [Acidobacteria bacterium]|nr:hypothetical protein [Acidobacteriota bacterium]